jgi:hypothetical protein
VSALQESCSSGKKKKKNKTFASLMMVMQVRQHFANKCACVCGFPAAAGVCGGGRSGREARARAQRTSAEQASFALQWRAHPVRSVMLLLSNFWANTKQKHSVIQSKTKLCVLPLVMSLRAVELGFRLPWSTSLPDEKFRKCGKF